jgi:predicted O-methyltransferase YrrM
MAVANDLESLKSELERFGEANDKATAERGRRMLNITRDTGEFLSLLLYATRAHRVLEIGTSNGYSTLWLAEAAQATGGTVTTVELSEYKADLAAATFARSGLAQFISLVHDDTARVLRGAGEAPSTSSSSIPSARSTSAGGRKCGGCCTPAVFSWPTTPSRTPRKCALSWRW